MEINKDLSCDIIKDLLPVYCDGQASDDSVKVIETHLGQCQNCKQVYEEMQGDLNTESQQEKDREIVVLKKARKRFRMKAVIGFLLGVTVCTLLFIGLFIGIVPLESDDVIITYTAHCDKTTVNDEESGHNRNSYDVTFHIALPEGEILNFKDESELQYADEDEMPEYTPIYKLYSVCKMPFDDLGEYPNEAELGYSSSDPFTEDEKFIFQFRDKTVTYNLKEIAEEAGIQ